MPDFYIDSIDISPSEFVDACSDGEINQLIEILIEDGYIDHKIIINNSNKTPDEQLFGQSLAKLIENKHRLTNAEEEVINKISNRL
jgi:hypothetical protein